MRSKSGLHTVPSSASIDAVETVMYLFDVVRKRMAAFLLGLFLSASWEALAGMRSVAGGVGMCLRGSDFLVVEGIEGLRTRSAGGVVSVSVSALRAEG
jgi:hypothetical protein